jgi:hypothetical protein
MRNLLRNTSRTSEITEQQQKKEGRKEIEIHGNQNIYANDASIHACFCIL